MKIFLIGGVSVENSDPIYAKQKEDLKLSMAELGGSIAKAGHDLLVCSPFEGSADAAAAIGALSMTSHSGMESDIEFHHPDTATVVAQMQGLKRRFPNVRGLNAHRDRLQRHNGLRLGRTNWAQNLLHAGSS